MSKWKPKSKRKPKKPPYVFRLNDRERIALQNWQLLESVSPKLACMIEDCGLSTVYERLNSGEYQAAKDGRNTKITTASIKARRAERPPWQPMEARA